MNKFLNYRVSHMLLLSAMLVLAFAYWGKKVSSTTNLAAISSQKKERKIEKAFSSTPQVQISTVKSGKTVRKMGEKFEDDEDWLKKLSFQIQNTSSKSIIYLSLNLNFPETKSSGSMMSYPLNFGQRPNARFKTNNAPLLLKPGDTLQISVDESYDELIRFVEERHARTNLHEVQIEIGFIIFEDNTAWSAGMFYKPDPENPGRYINIGDVPK